MAKSADAFRTISEVSEWLDTPAHVLRFWESKFTQVKPVKRAGGRRYYRPSDMELLGGIKRLLHEDGMTIKGVQKLLREKGVAHVADLSQPLDDVTAAVRDAMDGRAKKAAEAVEDAEMAPDSAERTQATPADPASPPRDAPAEREAPARAENPAASPTNTPVPAPAVTPVLGVPAAVPPVSTPTQHKAPPHGAADSPAPATADSLLAALYARSAPLPAAAAAEAAGLQQRLKLWLAADLR
ncbi:MerR family transcriptional regulator [Pseudooceanicola sp.]|uniref:MerR family transcriptional regulator n=1 Tax=Pseudooceanicola sp. TaxID=1914328 RepID=UPI0035C6E715